MLPSLAFGAWIAAQFLPEHLDASCLRASGELAYAGASLSSCSDLSRGCLRSPEPSRPLCDNRVFRLQDYCRYKAFYVVKKRYGPPNRRKDENNRVWHAPPPGARRGRDPVTVAGRLLPIGFHWDVEVDSKFYIALPIPCDG